MSRLILAAALAAATLVGWFLLSIARLAHELEAQNADDIEVQPPDPHTLQNWRI